MEWTVVICMSLFSHRIIIFSPISVTLNSQVSTTTRFSLNFILSPKPSPAETTNRTIFLQQKKHYDSSSNVESPQLKNQTPGKCGSHLRQSNPFAKNPRFLYQTSLQDLSPSLFSLVLISRNNTSLSFPFSLRWVLLLFYFFACYVELIYNIYGRFV